MTNIILDNGVRFHYQLLNQRGSQVPLVFISGYTGSILEWELYAQAMAAKGHPVLIKENTIPTSAENIQPRVLLFIV